MTSKEALERIKKSHKIAMAICCEGKKDEETEKAINIIEKSLEELKMLELFKRFKEYIWFEQLLNGEQLYLSINN